MQALILAAGLGSRLAPLTDSCPKSLIQVNGKPILFQQLDSLLMNGVSDIAVVAGYKAKILEKAVIENYPNVHIIENRDYAETNNMYSAYIARGKMGGQGFLLMNADVFFDASVISSLLRFPAENAIVTDIGTYIAESMKVTAENGRLTAIAKTIPLEQAFGTTIDVYKFSPLAANAFFSVCEDYIVKKGEKKLWSEVALNDILPQVQFAPCPVDGRWLEIDDYIDLATAEKLFAQ